METVLQNLPQNSSRTCRVNGIDLHMVSDGPRDGPLVILLHGFPDFWWGWRHQMHHLAQQGFHVVVPDMRGYNTSDKPSGVSSYRLDTLAADVVALAEGYGASSFRLAGHDWGGVIAWQVAIKYPKCVERLAILNAPHPDVFPRFVRRHPSQMLKSTYAAFFQLPWLPEIVLKSRNFARLRQALVRSSRPGTFTPEDLERYVEAWAYPGAITAMLNYYRALARRPWQRPQRVQPPALVVWGEQDAFLERGIALASLKLCDQGQSQFIGTAGHWVQLEETEMVNSALTRFFSPV